MKPLSRLLSMLRGWRGWRSVKKRAPFCLGCDRRDECTEICPKLRQHLRGHCRGLDFMSRWKRYGIRQKGDTPPRTFLFGNMDDVAFDENGGHIWNWRDEE